MSLTTRAIFNASAKHDPRRQMPSNGPECHFAMRRIATLVALMGVCAAVPQCGSTPPARQSSSLSSSQSTSTTSTLSSSPSHPAPPPPAAPSPATVGPVTAAELGATWKPGCPVGPEALRRVEMNYLGFDGQTHRGELVVHKDVVADVVAIFGQLYELGYPIAKMRSVANYAGA